MFLIKSIGEAPVKFVPEIRLIVEQAGLLVLSRLRSDLKISTKCDGSIVTEVDLACEQFLKKELRALIPGSGFFTEESAAEAGNDYCWTIDPIDGTKNFAAGLPYFCIAVALEHQGVIMAAVTYAPALKEWFCAELGQGMWWNDSRVTLQAEAAHVRTSLLIAGHAEYSKTQARKRLQRAGYSASWRYFGAAALDLGYVAAGCLDAFVSTSICWWDVAGGLLMVKEAGGLAVHLEQKAATREVQSFYAGKTELYHLLFDKNNSF